MKIRNPKTNRDYTVLSSKGNVIAAWCANVKPIKLMIDKVKVDVFANQEKSDYIYFLFNGIARCVWAKDPKEFDFLKETSLQVIDWGRGVKKDTQMSAAKAGVKARATKKDTPIEAPKPVRPIKVIKKEVPAEVTV